MTDSPTIIVNRVVYWQYKLSTALKDGLLVVFQRGKNKMCMTPKFNVSRSRLPPLNNSSIMRTQRLRRVNFLHVSYRRNAPEAEVVDAAGVATRCPVNPRDEGVATHAEHPAHPQRRAKLVTAFRQGAMVD